MTCLDSREDAKCYSINGNDCARVETNLRSLSREEDDEVCLKIRCDPPTYNTIVIFTMLICTELTTNGDVLLWCPHLGGQRLQSLNSKSVYMNSWEQGEAEKTKALQTS